MTDGVNGIHGGNSYGVGGYSFQPKPEEKEEAVQLPVNNYDDMQKDPEAIMNAMSMAAGFVAPKSESVRFVELDPATSARVAASMEDFEQFMKVASEEFGERNALLLADVYKG